MKYKYLLFDMGNTIIKNIKFDSIKAIGKLYDIINNSHINKESFINDGIKLINNMFINRDINHIEIPYQSYINELLLKYNIKRNTADLEYSLYSSNLITQSFTNQNYFNSARNLGHSCDNGLAADAVGI